MKETVKNNRILAIDQLRGYFLFVIIVDHLYKFPGFFDFFTGQGKLWVSAAEGFFLLSGLLVGFIYRDKVKEFPLTVWGKIWKRSAWLYLWSIFLTIFFTVWAWQMPSILIKQNWWTGDFSSLIVSTFALAYTYGWADFLPYYAVFMFFAPFALFLSSQKKWWIVLMTSVFLWLVREKNSYLAWQLVFFLGLLFGFYLPKIENFFQNLRSQLKKKLIAVWSTVTIVTLSISVFFTLLIPDLVKNWHFVSLEVWNVFYQKNLMFLFDKNTLGLGRVVFALIWIGLLYFVFRRFETQVEIRSRGILSFLGKNSLLVYCLHAILLFPINLLTPQGASILQNIYITFVFLLLIFWLTKVVVWSKSFFSH